MLALYSSSCLISSALIDLLDASSFSLITPPLLQKLQPQVVITSYLNIPYLSVLQSLFRNPAQKKSIITHHCTYCTACVYVQLFRSYLVHYHTVQNSHCRELLPPSTIQYSTCTRGTIIPLNNLVPLIIEPFGMRNKRLDEVTI